MQRATHLGILLVPLFLMLAAGAAVCQAEQIYKVSVAQVEKHKALFDDPRPLFKELSYKKIIPPEVYKKLTYDIEAMKKTWAEVVGFEAPEVVGKIAPEIKPGVYTFQDKAKYPGFKQLMCPNLYKRFAAGGPPHVGNFSEIEVVPTKQYYWALPIARATKENMGKAKLDAQGYLIESSYVSGYPFPRPSGPFKAQQIMYNWVKRYYSGENFYWAQRLVGFSGSFTKDFEGLVEMWGLRLHSRVLLEPYGWYDERAQKNQEARGILLRWLGPRDQYGNSFSILSYLNPNKPDLSLIFVSALRRIRLLSATDTQDAVGGQDIIYEDNDGFNQQLTPKRYPYKFEVLEEREFLVPSYVVEGRGMMDRKTLAMKGYKFERRPVYVIKLTQLDPNYVYGSRILYLDQETFMLYHIENFDQKGRLYRTSDVILNFIPEMGLLCPYDLIMRDYIDLHSVFGRNFTLPAAWVSRDQINLQNLVGKGK